MNKNKGQYAIRNILYEPPGPKARRKIAIGTVLAMIAVLALIYFIIRQFYITGQLDQKYWYFFGKWTTWRFLGEGLLGTIEAAVGAGIMAFIAGMLMMLGRLSDHKAIRAIATVFTEFTRGVPTLLFIYFFFLVVPQLGIKMSAYWKIAIPVALSASGVVGEVMRSGVNAVPKGQTEAAVSLGMRKWRTFFKIIFPQAFRYVIPALISELVIVLKDTTFAYVVNFADLMQNARVLISNYDALVSVYLVIAIIYILINYLLNKLSVWIGTRNQAEGGSGGKKNVVLDVYETMSE